MSVSRLLVLAVLIVGAACSAPPANPVSRHNVLLVTIDTLRADRVSSAIAPNIERLATRGLRFTNARTVAPLTLPAHVSIMTGQLPSTHGVRVNGVARDLGLSTLASRMKQAGYKTSAVIGAFVLDRRFGLASGFDAYDDFIHRDPAGADRLEAERPAREIIDRALREVSSLTASSQPWFLWVHLYDPHAPYSAPRQPEAPALPYDAEVRYADAELGRLIQAIDASPAAATTTIIVAGDHGEGLGEHGETTHGMLLFESTLRVPLVVSVPGGAPESRDDPVSLIDIAPTVIALAGAPSDPAMLGRNLLDDRDVGREIYAETEYPAVAGWRPARSLIQDRFKLISAGTVRLYDLSNDTSEENNLAATRAQTVAAMASRLDTLGAARPGTAPATRAPDADTAARLRALGYVATSPAAQPSTTTADAADHTAAWTAFERALSARTSGQHAESRRLLAELTQRYPNATVFEMTYAQVLTETGQHAAALNALRGLVRKWPNDATLYHELAAAAHAAGQHDEALRGERAALTIDPSLAAAHNGLGLLLTGPADAVTAAAAFEQAVKLDPTNGHYRSNLGNARRTLGDLDGARQAYEQALARDATIADAANGLGVVLVQQKRPSEAVPWFERAIAEDAGFLEARLNLAIALHESGQRDRALLQYREVERTAPPGTREREAAHALRKQLESR
jgi:arylsulfatase A-like enzyme/Tfp pilus assembly protein PilF